jgi:hypothetical protein
MMTQSRTVKTLLALVVCMTLGIFALVLMQTDPIRSPLLELASVTTGPASLEEVIARTDSPVGAGRWKNIIVHRDGRRLSDPDQEFHFVVHISGGEPVVRVTDLWKRQATGRHTFAAGGADWNADSVGVYVEPFHGHVTTAQVRMARRVCAAIQRLCDIGADHVYRVSDLP